MDPAGDHPAHNQRLPRQLALLALPLHDLDRLKSPTARRGGEDANPVLELLSRETVPYDPAHTALLGHAQARRTAEAHRARQGRPIEPQQLVSIGEAPGVLLGKLAGFYLDGLPVFLKPGEGLLHAVNLEDSVDPGRVGLRF